LARSASQSLSGEQVGQRVGDLLHHLDLVRRPNPLGGERRQTEQPNELVAEPQRCVELRSSGVDAEHRFQLRVPGRLDFAGSGTKRAEGAEQMGDPVRHLGQPDFARRDARQRIAFARPVAKRSQRICFGVDQVEVGEVGTQQLSERPEDAGDVGEHLVEVFVERPVALRARHEHRRDRDHA